MTATAAKFRFIGTTDECTECGLCGRMELRSTIVLAALDADGNDEEIVYYGSSCGAKALSWTGKGSSKKVLDTARSARTRLANEVSDARRMLAFYGLDGQQPFDRFTLAEAVNRFAHQHRNAGWASEKSGKDWQDMVWDMVARKTAIIRDAELIGL
jgi:hypothetical protein